MKELILNGCSELGIDISQKTADALIKYYEILVERNKSVNDPCLRKRAEKPA